MLLLEVLNFGLDSGEGRTLFPVCPVGETVNRALDTRENLDEAALLVEENGCFEYATCMNCPKGQDLTFVAFSESESAGLYAPYLSTHLRAFFDTVGTQGGQREFLQGCGTGKAINEITTAGPDGPEISYSLAEASGCLEYESCLECPEGKEVARNLLLDICEHGTEGEYGHLLKRTWI